LSEEEYITNENDPHAVEKITSREDYTLLEPEEVQEFDEIFETVRAKITDLVQHDKGMEQKVIDSLQNGDFE